MHGRTLTELFLRGMDIAMTDVVITDGTSTMSADGDTIDTNRDASHGR